MIEYILVGGTLASVALGVVALFRIVRQGERERAEMVAKEKAIIESNAKLRNEAGIFREPRGSKEDVIGKL